MQNHVNMIYKNPALISNNIFRHYNDNIKSAQDKILYLVADELAKEVSESLSIPTIGIGAGGDCDGQVLVTHDLLGLFDRFTPKFVKRYANLRAETLQAFSAYIEDVKNKDFPAPEHTVDMPDAEWVTLLFELEERS